MAKLLPGLVALLFLGSTLALAQPDKPKDQPDQPTPKGEPKDKDTPNDKDKDKDKGDQDQGFVRKAASSGMLEVQLGELASKQGARKEVQEFGQRMEADHTKVNDELKQIAAKKNLQVPDKMEDAHQKQVDRLAKLKGEEFDKAYMDLMVQEHKSDIDLFQRQAKNGKDPDLQAFAKKHLPHLEDHLKRAQDIAKSKG